MNIHWVWYRLHNHSEFLHTQGDSLYQSTLEYNQRIQVHIGLRILLQCLHLWKIITENPNFFSTADGNTKLVYLVITNGQVLGRSDSRKSAQVEAKSKISIFFRMIMTKKLTLART